MISLQYSRKYITIYLGTIDLMNNNNNNNNNLILFLMLLCMHKTRGTRKWECMTYLIWATEINHLSYCKHYNERESCR